jgi:hypothetical protein
MDPAHRRSLLMAGKAFAADEDEDVPAEVRAMMKPGETLSTLKVSSRADVERVAKIKALLQAHRKGSPGGR